MRRMSSAKLCPPDRLQKRVLPEIQIRPDDVFIVSYPRSGNTWVRFLLANLLAPNERITFRNIDDYVPSIYKRGASLDVFPSPRYIKSHSPCFELYPKTTYVYRDGRDALVSYYHYAVGKKVFSGTFEQFVFSPFIEQFTSWREHVISALDFAANRPDRILIFPYEEMLANPLPALTSMSSFLGLTHDVEVLTNAAEKSSFEQLQKIEKESGGETLGRKLTFFRSGMADQWRDYFSPELYERFLIDNKQVLQRLGYEL